MKKAVTLLVVLSLALISSACRKNNSRSSSAVPSSASDYEFLSDVSQPEVSTSQSAVKSESNNKSSDTESAVSSRAVSQENKDAAEESGQSEKKPLNFDREKYGRKLVWYDCFDGNKLNKNRWNPQVLVSASDIIQVMNDKTFKMKDGIAYLTSCYNQKGPTKTQNTYYTPLHLTTKSRMSCTYGYLELRAKAPFYHGNSFAFWLLTDTKKYNSANGSAEIDIVEILGRKNSIESTVHKYNPVTGEHFSFWPAGVNRAYTFESDQNTLSTEWHTYGLEWDTEKLKYYVDGNKYLEIGITENDDISPTAKNTTMKMFHDPMYIIISEYLYSPARTSLGNARLTGDEPEVNYTLEVDYVALYQRTGEKLYTY